MQNGYVERDIFLSLNELVSSAGHEETLALMTDLFFAGDGITGASLSDVTYTAIAIEDDFIVVRMSGTVENCIDEWDTDN